MPKGHTTSLFVSSTCFDLSQVRTDIRDFANSIGLDPILSELDTFPVNPHEKAIDNCLEVVRNRADIFLLIVGGRYGTLADAGKSVTNMEYYEACVKGIPKYVFIKKEVLNLLPIWDANKSADFSAAVDTPQLFEFISELKNSDELWVFPFVSAQEIISTLRKQLSYLFSDCLDLRRRFHKPDLDLDGLRQKSLRIVVEKPKGWEYLLFAQLLQDRVQAYYHKKLDVELGISFGEPIVLRDLESVKSWVSSRLQWMVNLHQQISGAVNNGFEKAFGEPGQPSDIERIIHLTSRIGDGYNQLLEWKLQFLRTNVNEKFEKLIVLISELASNSIKGIEDFSCSLYNQIEMVCKNEDNYEKGAVVNFTLTFCAPDTTEINRELSRLVRIAPLMSVGS